MKKPPGGFFTLAFVLLVVGALKRRKALKARESERRNGAIAERAA